MSQFVHKVIFHNPLKGVGIRLCKSPSEKGVSWGYTELSKREAKALGVLQKPYETLGTFAKTM